MTPKYTPAQIRLVLQHPLPWKYSKTECLDNSVDSLSQVNSITDASNKEILREDQVSQVVFDAIWDLGCVMNGVFHI